MLDLSGGENSVGVVDGDPAHPPAGNEVPLGEAAAAEDRDRGGQAGHRDVRLVGALKDKVLIDFVCNDWDAVTLGDGQDLLQVSCIKYRAARIGWVINHDGLGVLVNHGFHVIKINHPVLLW